MYVDFIFYFNLIFSNNFPSMNVNFLSIVEKRDIAHGGSYYRYRFIPALYIISKTFV